MKWLCDQVRFLYVSEPWYQHDWFVSLCVVCLGIVIAIATYLLAIKLRCWDVHRPCLSGCPCLLACFCLGVYRLYICFSSCYISFYMFLYILYMCLYVLCRFCIGVYTFCICFYMCVLYRFYVGFIYVLYVLYRLLYVFICLMLVLYSCV